jgi:hypothetical protein
MWDSPSGTSPADARRARVSRCATSRACGSAPTTSGWGPGADGKGGPFVQLWSVDALRAADEGEMPDRHPGAGSIESVVPAAPLPGAEKAQGFGLMWTMG